MSWLFGISWKPSRTVPEFDLHFLPEAHHKHTTPNLLIRAGGMRETCLFDNHSNGWCVCGTGIRSDRYPYSFLTGNEWTKVIESNSFTDNPPDGHFAIFRWSDRSVEGFTDRLGIREIYIAEKNDAIVFSTCLEWVVRFNGEYTIDPAVFGSRWLLINQISTGSFIPDITRLSRGESFNITDHSLRVHNAMTFALHKDPVSTEEIKQSLQAMTVFPLEGNGKLSLSLSGGFDSRVLFSILLKHTGNDWDAHTFGDAQHPDAAIARKMCKDFRIPHTVHTSAQSSIDDIIHAGKEIAAKTAAIFPASSVLQLHHYHELAPAKRTVIDGGFGEIWRRGFMNKVFYKGARSLRNGDYKSIAMLLRSPRSDIFNGEFNNAMDRGCIDQLDTLFTHLYRQTTSLDLLLDLFMIHTRIPNIYGPEQSRVDGFVRNYMPFIQPGSVSRIMRMPMTKRKNGIVMREIINASEPSVKAYPLVKGTTTYPYWQPTLISRAWTKLKEKAGYTYREKQQYGFLDYMKPYILDTIGSERVRNSPVYAPAKIASYAERYYKGEKQFAHSLDWWLAFEWMMQRFDGVE